MSTTVPPAVAAFLAGPAKKFENPVANFPTWKNAKLKFQEVSDWTPIELDMDLKRSRFAGCVPIATIQDASEFIVVDTSDPALPVKMYDHEVRKLVRGYDSFEDFVSRVREGE